MPVRNLGQDLQYDININRKDAEGDLMGFAAFQVSGMTELSLFGL